MHDLPTITHLDEETGELVAADGRRFLSDDLCMLLDAALDAGGYSSQKLSDTYGPWFTARDEWEVRQ